MLKQMEEISVAVRRLDVDKKKKWEPCRIKALHIVAVLETFSFDGSDIKRRKTNLFKLVDLLVVIPEETLCRAMT